jgi:hypothetical protein
MAKLAMLRQGQQTPSEVGKGVLIFMTLALGGMAILCSSSSLSIDHSWKSFGMQLIRLNLLTHHPQMKFELNIWQRIFITLEDPSTWLIFSSSPPS